MARRCARDRQEARASDETGDERAESSRRAEKRERNARGVESAATLAEELLRAVHARDVRAGIRSRVFREQRDARKVGDGTVRTGTTRGKRTPETVLVGVRRERVRRIGRRESERRVERRRGDGEGVPTSGARIVSESVFGADGESERTVARYRERIGKERRRDRGGFHRVYFE